MPKIDSALWRDMMEYLRRRHAPICRQWFEELEPIGLDAGLLRVYTPSHVQQNYLQRKCLEQFNDAAQAATGALVAVRFVNSKDGSNGAAEHPAWSAAPALALPGAPSLATLPARPAPMRSPEPAAEAAPAGGEVHFEQIVISPDYVFENFVTGPGNNLACAAAVAVANQPGTAYNPLFIHGGVGLGKTHLLQAICQQIMHLHPELRICYLSCESFMNQFLDCVQRGQMAQFRHRYRNVDVLVIDDIHFLADKERTQEEFFHTFNELYQSNRQIVLSSDSPPQEIPQLEERLVSRFQWGLVANVTRPCFETRVAIIKAKAKIRGLNLPDDVIAYIAGKIESNARELEGAITTIQGHAALQNEPINLTMAQLALGEPAFDARNGEVTLQQIIEVVTAYYNVKLSDLQSKHRQKSITMPRQVCMWLARKLTRFSLQEVGGYFGGRDHTTVMHSLEIVQHRVETDLAFAQQVQELSDRIAKRA
jgi:chromosomal replication initiator protein